MGAQGLYRFRSPFSSPQEQNAPPPDYRRTVDNGMIVERNVPVRMRDGVEIYADVMRPADEKPAPPNAKRPMRRAPGTC